MIVIVSIDRCRTECTDIYFSSVKIQFGKNPVRLFQVLGVLAVCWAGDAISIQKVWKTSATCSVYVVARAVFRALDKSYSMPIYTPKMQLGEPNLPPYNKMKRNFAIAFIARSPITD